MRSRTMRDTSYFPPSALRESVLSGASSKVVGRIEMLVFFWAGDRCPCSSSCLLSVSSAIVVKQRERIRLASTGRSNQRMNQGGRLSRVSFL